MASEMFIFARFHAKEGEQQSVADESAFDRHAQLPHTMRFVDKIQTLIDHPLEATRTRLI